MSPNRSIGWCAAVLLSGLLAAAPAPSAPAPAPAESGLPAGLEWVPPDAPGFITMRLADVLDSESVKEFRKLMGAQGGDPFGELKWGIGLAPEDIERLTLILRNTFREEPIVVITTRKAVDQKQVKAAMLPTAPDGGGYQENKTPKGKTYFINQATMRMLYFAGERVFLTSGSDTKTMEDLLDRSPQSREKSRFAEAFQAAEKQPVVAAVDLKHYAADIQRGLPEEAKPLLPLFDAGSAFLTVVSGKDTTADLRLTFANGEQVQAAEKAVKAGIDLGRKYVGMGQQELAKAAAQGNVPEPLKPLLQRYDVMLKDLDAALQAASVKQEEGGLRVSGRMKSDVGLLLAMFGRFTNVRPTPAPPPPSPVPEKRP
jgi:hypothetical protein